MKVIGYKADTGAQSLTQGRWGQRQVWLQWSELCCRQLDPDHAALNRGRPA